MIIDGYAGYNLKIAPSDTDSQVGLREPATEPTIATTSAAPLFERESSPGDTSKTLHARLLAKQVGYLQVDRSSKGCLLLATMPKQSFPPNQFIPCSGLLCVIDRGSVLIKHARDKYPVKEMYAGGVFGEMPSMAQTMLTAEAIAGASGATVTIMNLEQALQWMETDPRWFVAIIAPRLAEYEASFYQGQFQRPESRLAGLLLKLGGNGAVIKELTPEAIAEMTGLGREMVTVKLLELWGLGLIETTDGAITILDEDALRRMGGTGDRG